MKRLLLAAAATLALASPAAAFTFNHTGTIITWAVPTTGVWEVVAVGAQGGAGTETSFVGGRGALIGGEFELTSGMVLEIGVGGMGASSTYTGALSGNFNTGGGGGGGSFVVQAVGDVPLVIAGGGGGVGRGSARNGWDANTGQDGLTSSGLLATGGGAPRPGLIPGQPFSSRGMGGAPAGFTSSILGRGAGGGGFFSHGARDNLPGNILGPLSFFFGLGGGSYAEGLPGGLLEADCGGRGGNGGFGGGGAGCMGGGGGGGYSGGNGGLVAGGGGSYNADTVTGWSQAGVGTGDGYITINYLREITEPPAPEPQVSTPEPASAALSLLGFFALAAIRRRR